MPHRILVCGSRDWTDYQLLGDTLDQHRPTEIAHGGARGADRLADRWASEAHVPCRIFEANWEREGKAAGFMRNQRMLDQFQPHLVLAFKDDFDETLKQGGTEHMVKIARQSCYETLVINRFQALGLFD